MRRIARKGWRQLSLLMAILLAFSLLADRLYALQIGQASNNMLQTYFADDVAAPQTEKPPRGTVVDVNGTALVSTVTVYKLAAAPPYITKKMKPVVARVLTDVLFPVRLPSGKQVHNKKAIARARATYLTKYHAILNQLNATWTYVCIAGDDSPTCPYKEAISRATADTIEQRINKLGVSGISLEARIQPSYPNSALASQVLGYVDYQYPNGQPVDTGEYGVQQYYDNLLSGIPGHTAVRFDTEGKPIRVGTGTDTPPQPGATLRLTIDSFVQLLVERDLNQVMKAQHATGGSIVVERPDGAILAMASTPSYDPNVWKQTVAKLAKQAGAGTKHFNRAKFNQAVYNLFPNPAISKEYEPGSTFKAFTIAIGFDQNLFNENTAVYDSGHLDLTKQYGYIVRNWCGSTCAFGGPETPDIMLHYSSNIAAVQFNRQIPALTWYQYVLGNFDFGTATGIDLAGEVPGDVRQPNDKPPKPLWVGTYKITQAYGQGLGVTPLQLTNGYAALGNGGMLPHPHVLASYTLGGKTVTPAWPPLHRAISKETSDRMVKLLVHQAIDGEACLALVPGYNIAAKTGTASIPSLGGNYLPNTTIASTAAFGPVDADLSHQFVILVKVDKPATQWGSEVAAPVVHDIFQHLFDYYKIAPSLDPVQPTKKYCSGPNS